MAILAMCITGVSPVFALNTTAVTAVILTGTMPVPRKDPLPWQRQ